jgi:hypothetical protein
MTSRVYLCRAGDFLAPTDEEGLKLIRKIGEGEEVAFKPLRVRSLAWHRRYWKLMQDLAAHISEINISLGDQPVMMPIASAHDLHTAIKLITGHCITQHIKGTGYVLRIPKPTNFDEMTADEWSEFYPRALDAVHERALPLIDVPELEDELARLAS